MFYNWKYCSFYPNNFGASALTSVGIHVYLGRGTCVPRLGYDDHQVSLTRQRGSLNAASAFFTFFTFLPFKKIFLFSFFPFPLNAASALFYLFTFLPLKSLYFTSQVSCVSSSSSKE